MKKIILLLFTLCLSLFALGCQSEQQAGGGKAQGELNYAYSFNFSEKTLSVGESAQIIASYGDKVLSYQSSNTAVATVSETGLVTGVGKGVAYITISAQGAKQDVLCEITVEQPVYTISFAQENGYEVFVGANKKLQVTLLRDGVAYNDTVTWSVDGGATLSVDGTTAMFTANAAGKYTVTVTSSAGAVNTLEITVIDQVVSA